MEVWGLLEDDLRSEMKQCEKNSFVKKNSIRRILQVYNLSYNVGLYDIPRTEVSWREEGKKS